MWRAMSKEMKWFASWGPLSEWPRPVLSDFSVMCISTKKNHDQGPIKENEWSQFGVSSGSV